ncbi:hypothetical protein CMI37_21960, partial [Candidatus Pacearchaeota archaeon]|nr:hypothetical protein [Candidatus Pacearchaeota archaeon]
MIITQDKNKQVVQSHDFDSVNCTIDAEDMRYVASLLRNNYSNPSLAVVREISANALDANLEANASRKVEVTVPSQLNPHFVVRDFGGGLSQDDIFGLYSKYGKSTKRDSNNYIGAFGIGKFAPLSYGNNFTVVSYHGGKKISYNVFVNEDDDTKIVKLNEVRSHAPTGLSVEVAIADDDVDTFRDIIKNFFRFFSDEEMPKFIGVGEDEKFFPDFEVVMEAKDGSWRILEDEQDYWARNHHESHAIMGRVHYPLNAQNINFQAMEGFDDSDNQSVKKADNLRELANQDNLYIRFPIGALKLHHSRESLEYNKNTQKEILSVLQSVREDIEAIAKEKLGDAEDLWDAKVKYAQVINALPHGLRNIFANSFEWDGMKIDSPSIDRNHKYQDEVIITDYFKQNDADATDGYKVRSQKTHRIHPDKNTVLYIQDNKSYHGNNMRARTLFNEDETLEKVTAVYWSCEAGEIHVYEDMGFNKINKDRIGILSNVEKAKLQSKGKSVSGESRADVPVFELDTEGKHRYKSRNALYWLNCNENIDELEESERELIYIPIANYKIVNENGTGQEATLELDTFLRDVKGVENIQKALHDQTPIAKTGVEFESPLIIGVRRKDCGKLDKARWSSWADYKKNFAKSYLVDHLDKVLESEKAMAFKEQQYSMDEYRCIHQLVENGKFR